MNLTNVFSTLAILGLAAVSTQAEESPTFWTNQGGLVRPLTLEGGLGDPVADVEVGSGIEMKNPHLAIFPYTFEPEVACPCGVAEFIQFNLNTLELEVFRPSGPATWFDPTFNSEGHLLTVGVGNMLSEPSIVDWDLTQETFTTTPFDISPQHLVGLASYGGFLYGVSAPAPYHFLEIDPETGDATVLNSDFLPGSTTFVGMDFDYDGILWVAHQGAANLELGRITNLNTLAIEPMGSFPATDAFTGIAVVPRDDVIAIPTLGPYGILFLGFLIGGLGLMVLRLADYRQNGHR